jgi:hypothetical protein
MFIDFLRFEKLVHAARMYACDVVKILFSVGERLSGVVRAYVLHSVMDLLVYKPFFPGIERVFVTFRAYESSACIRLKVLYQM